MLVLVMALLQAVPPPVLPVATDTTTAATAAAPPTQERQQPTPTPRWASSLDFGFASSSGNSELLSLTSGLRVRHLQTRRFKLDWTAAFRYGQSQGEVVARNLQSKLDFEVGPSARVAPFVYASGERDPFRRLDLRARTGSGVRYAFHRSENGDASIRLAAQYSHERFTAAASRDPNSDAGWSMELKGQQRVGDVLRIENSSVFDPVLNDIGNFNLEIRSKVVSRVSKRMALTLTHAFNYDSTPPVDVGTTDQRFQAGISIDF